ncbi:MAG: hypothetical protein KA821_14205 [Chitinophagaceae bacterium]|nr:hypothetical protein [Chitinophagaceae bacterium]
MNSQITFEQFKKEFESFRNTVIQIHESDFGVLWINDYYDGMLTGMLEFQSKKYWFEIIGNYEDNPRYFAVLELTPEQIAVESYWNNLFKEYVGNHNNYDSNETHKIKPQKMHHLFYDRYKIRTEPDYNPNPVHTWFLM